MKQELQNPFAKKARIALAYVKKHPDKFGPDVEEGLQAAIDGKVREI